ncbi:hypothetical protein Ahy_B01g052074 [Arachis hypogaea]|uniref:Uncharacterized protein n=1 Tax=Arachis hypogaea TaxID=3818 RepID=A0A445ANI7_ARAHY|nr:hypothetical protein Ahy_B01g052074 [Arachis hypogaea]
MDLEYKIVFDISVYILSWQFCLRSLVAVPFVFSRGSSVYVSSVFSCVSSAVPLDKRQFRLRFLQTSGRSVCTFFRKAAVPFALPSDKRQFCVRFLQTSSSSVFASFRLAAVPPALPSDKRQFHLRFFPAVPSAPNTVLQKLGLQKMKRIEKLYYRSLISVVREGMKYDLFFSYVRIPELLAKVVDVVSNSGRSKGNHQSIPIPAASSSTSIVASSSFSVIASVEYLVASPSFAGDLHRDETAELGANINTHAVGESNAVEVVLGDEDDGESATIDDDNNDNIGKSIPVGIGGASSRELSSTHCTFLL